MLASISGAAQTSARSSFHHPVFPARLHLSLLVALALGPWLPAWVLPAAAQGAVSLSSLQVSLWPEYDQAATLVILDGQLAPGVALPASLSVRIPARAGQPHAVAVSGAGGQLLTAAYTTQTADDDIIVLFQTQSLGFRVEYYDPALTITDEARQFAFDWQTDFPIAAVAVRVQEPVGARDLAGEPALTALGASGDGLNYYQVDLGPLQPGERAALSLSYAKADSTLTADALSGGSVTTDPAQPVPQPVAPASPDTTPFIIAGAALGLTLGVAGIVAYGLATKAARAKAARRARQARAPSACQANGGFCTQCGQGLVAGDRFCRNCGAGAGSS